MKHGFLSYPVLNGARNHTGGTGRDIWQDEGIS